MANIILKKGNLLHSEGSIAHCVGVDLALGAGVALQIRNTYFDKTTQQTLLEQQPSIGKCLVFRSKPPTCSPYLPTKPPTNLPSGGRNIYNLVTKLSSRRDKPTKENFLAAVMSWKVLMEQNGETHCNIPKIGCGLDKLNWEKFVLPALQILFQNSDITLYVWEL